MRNKTKKKYEPVLAQIVKFETEDVLSESEPFMGDSDEFSLRSINASSQEKKQDQVNPV